MKIDGTKSLADQESAIQIYEAAGYELLGFFADSDGDPVNELGFNDLPPGQHPSTANLVVGSAIPAGKKLVCYGTIYVAGVLSQVSAFR
jgi:hypothetical protein